MNLLIVGTHKATIFEHLPDRFLLLDDGELIDQLELPSRRKVVRFDISKNHFNPLKHLNYTRAREFVAVLDAVFPEGENTLTKATFNYQLLEALCANPKRLTDLIPDSKDTQYAYQKIQTLLLSPVLNSVLTKPTNFPLNGVILARLNRAELGDFDCFVLGNLLISMYPGQIVIPDFGFYGHKGHTALIRQKRLIAGVNWLDEVPDMRNQLLLIDKKSGQHCTAKDAEVLAGYAGLTPHSNGYNDFVQSAIE